MSSPPPVVQALAVRLALNFESKPKDMGLCYTGGAGDRCWVQGMFRGYVSGVCFGYVSRHHELLYLQFRGYVTGYVSGVRFGVCFAGVQQCNPSALLKSGPPKKKQTHILVSFSACVCLAVMSVHAS